MCDRQPLLNASKNMPVDGHNNHYGTKQQDFNK
ncbi:unnamed protein product, partial [Rotaria sordida]